MNWYFGEGAALNFSDCTPVALTDCNISEVNSTATMSDENGKLLYYVSSGRITNRNHQIMTNGDDIDIYNWNISQSIITIPKPGSKNSYLVFTIGDKKRAKLLYHEIDLSEGLGKVLIKNQQVFDTDITMKMSAINHANGEDVWLMVQGLETGIFYSFLITKDGISNKAMISDFDIGGVDIYEYSPLKFSPDGTKMATANTDTRNSQLFLYHFDNNSGKLSGEIKLYSIGRETPKGIEFSPNNNVVFLTARSGYCSPGTSYLYQYDVSNWKTNNINNSREIIKTTSENISFLQLAIDGRIYIGGRTNNCEPDQYLDVINYPNSLGKRCDYVDNAIYLGGKTAYNGLSNFNQSYFDGINMGDLPDTYFACPLDTISVSPGEFTSYNWSTGQNDAEIEIHKEGTYSVEFTNKIGCIFKDSVSLLHHKVQPIKFTGSTEICKNESAWIAVGEYKNYLWSNGEIKRDVIINQEGWYSVNVTTNEGCYSKDSVFLKVNQLPEINLEDYYITEADTLIINPGLFNYYKWNTGSIGSTFEIIGDNLTLGSHQFSIQVENTQGCSSREEFSVHVKPADRPVENELSFQFKNSSVSVTNKSAIDKNHEIIIYDLKGAVCLRENIPAESNIEFPFSRKGIYIVMLRSNTDKFTKKLMLF